MSVIPNHTVIPGISYVMWVRDSKEYNANDKVYGVVYKGNSRTLALFAREVGNTSGQKRSMKMFLTPHGVNALMLWGSTRLRLVLLFF